MTFRNWYDLAPALKKILLILTGSIVLIIPALINGFPLIYSDTSTYIASGFTLQPPMDRPIGYGIFLRLVSLNGITLWTVLLVQGWLLSWMLFRITSILLGENTKYQHTGFLVALFISALSGAAWTTSYLLPDVFTVMMVLSFLLLVLTEGQKRNRTGYYILFGLSLSTHSSHLPLGVLLIFLLLVLWGLDRKRALRRYRIRQLAILSGIMLLGYFSMATSLSKSKHVFLMGAFVEQGIIQEYLKENCGHKDYLLCEYRDSLPALAWEFIWEPSSPLYKLGGWKETRDEFNEIISETIVTPKYLLMHVKTSVRETARQLIRFKSVDVYGVAPNNEQLRGRIATYIPSGLRHFDRAIQNRTNLRTFAWLNPVQLVLVLFSLLLIPGLLISKSLKNQKPLIVTGIVLVFGILSNAFICGTFGNAIDRMGNKMIWLLPFFATVLIFNRRLNKQI